MKKVITEILKSCIVIALVPMLYAVYIPLAMMLSIVDVERFAEFVNLFGDWVVKIRIALFNKDKAGNGTVDESVTDSRIQKRK